MATLNLALAANVLQEFYLPGLQRTLNDETSPTYNMIESHGRNIQGTDVIFSIHTRRNPGTGSRAELGTLPTAGQQGYEKATTGLGYHYGRVQFSGVVMRQAKTSPGSFVDAAGEEMSRIEIDIKHDHNRQIFNDANEALVTTTGVDAGQTVPINGASQAELRSLIIGMRVDIGTSGSATAGADSVVIESVDLTEGAETVTFEAGGDVTAVTSGMFIRKEDNFGNEMTGLRTMVNSGDSLFGVNGATVAPWNSYVDDNGGTLRTPSENLIEKTLDNISIKSGKVPNLFVSPHDVIRNVAAQLKSAKRYNDTVDLKGGFKGISISTTSGECTLVADRFAPDNTMFALSTDDLVFNELSDWEFMSEDGAVLNRLANQDGYEATLFRYSELTLQNRNHHGRINDLQGA